LKYNVWKQRGVTQPRSERCALCRLGKLAIVGGSHLPPDLDEQGLERACASPVVENGQFGGIDFAIGGIDKWKIDTGDESNERWPVGVLWATGNGEAVDAVLVGSVSWPDDCSVPVCH